MKLSPGRRKGKLFSVLVVFLTFPDSICNTWIFQGPVCFTHGSNWWVISSFPYIDHKHLSIFFLPFPAEDGMHRAAFVGTWHSANVNPPCLVKSKWVIVTSTATYLNLCRYLVVFCTHTKILASLQSLFSHITWSWSFWKYMWVNESKLLYSLLSSEGFILFSWVKSLL